MVNTDIYIKKIIAIDTLLSFDGIIPSFSAFQQKMIRLIRQLQISLHKEGAADADIERLCRLIAIWLDKRTETRLDHKFYSWDDYSLEHILYSHKSDRELFAKLFIEVLEDASQPVKRYACRIAQLYSAMLPQDQVLLSALANVPPPLAPVPLPVETITEPPHSKASSSALPQASSDCPSPPRRMPLAESAGLLVALLLLWLLSIIYLGSLF